MLFNLPPKDSLSIKDKVSAPKVSFIRRLYWKDSGPKSATYRALVNIALNYRALFPRLNAVLSMEIIQVIIRQKYMRYDRRLH